MGKKDVHLKLIDRSKAGKILNSSPVASTPNLDSVLSEK